MLQAALQRFRVDRGMGYIGRKTLPVSYPSRLVLPGNHSGLQIYPNKPRLIMFNPIKQKIISTAR